MHQKIQTLLAHLNHGLVEREAALKTALLAVLAGENVVLIGPPGTGKSLLARRIAKGLGVDDESYFEYLLTKFSTPEELFGPLSISELKKDRFHRNTAGYLPSVELAFLDEVFKASSSILNALLTMMNERIFHNGADREDAPLKAVIAASNELPTGQEELAALYDRFLVRSFVDYVRQESLPLLLAAPPTASAPPLAEHIAQEDMERLKQDAQAVTLPPDVAQALQQIWQAHRDTFKEDRRESLSDRRLMKCLNLLRVSAATNGRAEVDLSDVLLLKDCLWNHPDNRIEVQKLITSTLLAFDKPISDAGQGDFVETRETNRQIRFDKPFLLGTCSVEKLHVQEGDVVKEGQHLATVVWVDRAISGRISNSSNEEIISKYAGKVIKLKIKPGDRLSVGHNVVALVREGYIRNRPVEQNSDSADALARKMQSNIWL